MKRRGSGTAPVAFQPRSRYSNRSRRRTARATSPGGSSSIVVTLGPLPSPRLRESPARRKRRAHGGLAAAAPFCSVQPRTGEKSMTRLTALLTSAILFATPAIAAEAVPRPDQLAFREIYKELVETNTTLSSGSCTLAAERMAARLKAAGLKDDQLTLFAVPDKPKEGGLVAIYPGTSKTAKPILLIAHIDVVEAKRADWERDPFVMVEENGYFYGRGTADIKSQAAVWVDTLIRFQQQGYKPSRTVKMALTCGEETNGAFNGVEWLAANERDLIDAEFALNEGGGGDSDGKGNVIGQSVQVGEKTFANFRLETRNPGGHSSAPVPDNAIYQLARAVTRVEEHRFTTEMTDTTRRLFAEAGAARGDETGKAMVALANNMADKTAEAIVNKDPFLHSNLRSEER